MSGVDGIRGTRTAALTHGPSRPPACRDVGAGALRCPLSTLPTGSAAHAPRPARTFDDRGVPSSAAVVEGFRQPAPSSDQRSTALPSSSAGRRSSRRTLGSLDALHLAAALILPPEDLVFATWDRRLHAAAGEEGLALLPETVA
jgi:hypothetical protein